MRSRSLEALRIVGLCTGLSVAYGVVHDLMSTQVCLEYFTVNHPPVFSTENPFLLALGWGVIATWWMGAALGVMLALFATAGSGPAVTAKELARPLVRWLAVLLAGAVLIWLFAYWVAPFGLNPHAWKSDETLPELDRRLVASGFAHLFSYGGSVAVGIGMAVWATLRRVRRGVAQHSGESSPNAAD